MAEEQSSESDGYYTPEEELVCPKLEGPITKKGVSITAESDGYYNPEEELVCPKSEGPITKKGVSITAESDGYYTPEQELVCSKPEGLITKKGVSITAEGTSFTLSEANLMDIIEKIYTTCPKWYYIGLQLKVPVYILDNMKNEPSSVCLTKVIQYWLTHMNPSPTWRALANVLRMPTVGEGQLAGEIERQCCDKEEERAVNEIDGSKAETGHLSIDDLGIVLEALYDVRAKWYHLGIQLKVRSGTLESISQSYCDDLERLCQLLKHWLSNTTSASWNDLTVMLRSQEERSLSVKGCLVLPPQPSHRCQPRQNEVEQLHLKFKDLRKKNGADKVVTLYIVGLPAFGKTTLASLFAQYYYKGNKEQVPKLFIGFIDATSRATLLESYCTLADETGHTDMVKEVRQLSGSEKELLGLQLLVPLVKKELKGQTKWLLVVDNLTVDVKPLQMSKRSTARSPYANPRRRSDWVMFIPQPGDCSLGEGYVLVTTQEGKLVEKANDCVGKHNLKDGMSPSDAVELLESTSGLEDSELALDVVETLHRIPLSIAAAGYYIRLERDQRNEHYGYKDYLGALKAGVQEQSEELLAEENQSYSLTLNFALDMCAHQQASNPKLYRVFILMSFCAYIPVPMRVVAHLLGQHPEVNSPVMQSVRDCSLLQTNNIKMEGESVEVISLHQTTWQLLRDKLLVTVTEAHAQLDRTATPFLSVRDVATIFQNVTAAFVAQYPHIHENVGSSVKYYEKYLQPHLESLAHFGACRFGITLDPVQEFYLYSCLGRNYKISGQSVEAEKAYEHAVEVSHNCPEQKWRQSTDPETVEVYLGNLYSSRGKAGKAEGILKAVLTSLQVKCGESSTEFAHALQGLGYAYQNLRLYEESQCCYERAIAIENLINPDNPRTACLNIDVGCLLMSKGDDRQCITYFERAISELRNMPLNSEIIKVLDYIGNAHIKLGELEQGIQAREESLHFAEKLYGLKHRRCVITCATLSFSYLRLGKFSKSIKYAEKAGSALQSHNTFEHGCFTWLEKKREDNFSFQLTISCFNKTRASSLRMALSVLHIDSLCLAPVLAIHGRFQAAKGYVSRAVEYLSNLGLDCEGVTKIVPPLIAALCGKTADAQELVQQFLVSKDLQWRKVHLHLLFASFQVHLELGRYAEGLKLLPIIEGELEDGKGAVASDLLPLLTLPYDPECIWESAGAIHEYLRTIQSFLSSSVPLYEYFYTIHEGFQAFRKKEFCKAEQCFSIALTQEETDKQPNLVSLDTVRMYGTSLYHQGKLLEAAKCLEECISNARSLCSSHPLVGKISYTLAQVYCDRGQKELAVPRFKEAQAIFECSYKEHPLVATIAASISS